MRRVCLSFFLVAALLGAAALRADNVRSVLGAAGEVYTVQRGTYASLFADVPAGAGGYIVLALDVVRDGKLKRQLVPETGGPEDEQAPALVFDAVSNRAYLLWLENTVFNVAGFGPGGWQQPVELAGDPASAKRNPQLATSVVRYETLDGDGNPVAANRTLLHLVWYDDSAAGQRLLYTAAAIEGDTVVPGTEAFDLRQLAGNAPALAGGNAVPASLGQRPLARRGRDGDNVGLAFVDGERSELVTLDMRPIDADLLCFADKARAVIIETGRNNPGLPRAALIDKARAVIIETGHRLMHPVVADFLSKAFLDDLTASDPTLALEVVTDGAWAELIETGISLQQGSQTANSHVFELAPPQSDGTSRALDLRWVSRRALPQLPDVDLKLFLSPRAEEASVAWSIPSAVRYRETNPLGWEPQRSLALGPTLSRDQAFKLVESHLDNQ